MFKIEGSLDGKKCCVTWDNAVLSGDKTVIKKAEKYNNYDMGRLGFYPFVCDKNYLSEEIPAFCLIYDSVFDTVDCLTSNWEKSY